MVCYDSALAFCNEILSQNPKYNIALYHKERILFSMQNFAESILCCDSILNEYPYNGDVLFDKSCNLIMMSNFEDGLEQLERAIAQNVKFKIKAKNSKPFEQLSNDKFFQKLVYL